jgi:PKD repeat protein
MPSASGAVGGLIIKGAAQSQADTEVSVTVQGAAVASFDAELDVAKTSSVSEFDATLLVCQFLPPTSTITFPAGPVSSGDPASSTYNTAFSGVGEASGDKTIIEYTWFFNDTASFTSVSGSANTEHTFTGSGLYTVVLRVQDSEGLYGFDTIQIDTASGQSLPLLTSSGVPQSGTNPLVVNFTASASGVAGTFISGYRWNFGNNSFSTRQDPSGATFWSAGQYVPVVWVFDSRGIVVSDTIEVGANN